MNNLFRPAIALMNRLKYPQKFLLISFLFAVPLILVMTLFILEINSKIDFGQRELYGDAYLRPLRRLFEHSLQEQRIAYDILNGNTSRKEELLSSQIKIDEDFMLLKEVDRAFGDELETTEQLTALQAEWIDLKNKTADMNTHMSDDMYTTFTAHIRSLISRVGDTSNLILDPDLDSYYLMDAVLLKLPEMQDLLAQTNALGDQLIHQKNVSASEQTQLIILTGLIESNLSATEHGIEVAFSNNPGQNLSSLQTPLREYISAVEGFLQTLNTEVVNTPTITIQPEIYQVSATKALDGSFAFWDHSIVKLDELVQARIAGFNQRKYLAISITALVIVLVVYTWMAFYLAVMRTVSSLDEASRRMISGAMPETVQLDNRDELGQIARSFNNVATALIAASTQRQAIVDNAVDGILTIDEQGVVDSFNPAAERIFGYSAAEVIGQPVATMIPPPDHDQCRIVGVGREVVGRRKDGSTFPLDLAIGEMSLNGQRTFIGIAHDLTERKRADAERARLQEEIIRAQAAMLAELSTPLIPITDQVMVMPLIGAVDSQRAQQVMDTLLHGIEQTRARVAILDITGVPVVDTQVASGLIRAAQAVKLLGAQLVLTGIRPEVAQTLVDLGANLSGIVTHSTLQSGFAYATQSNREQRQKLNR